MRDRSYPLVYLPCLLSGAALSFMLIGCKEPPPLSQLQGQIVTRSCVFSSCHSGAGAAGGLDLKTGAFDHLVNAKSMQVPSKLRVVPGDPDASYLMEKLTSSKPTVGQRMPPNSDPLPDEELEMFREWIAGGALNN
jgi:hypothetical protein